MCPAAEHLAAAESELEEACSPPAAQRLGISECAWHGAGDTAERVLLQLGWAAASAGGPSCYFHQVPRDSDLTRLRTPGLATGSPSVFRGPPA